MFRVIGVVVVYGFALYGLAMYLERRLENTAFNPEAPGKARKAAGEPTTAETVSPPHERPS